MKSMGELFSELGFNTNTTDETKEAFVRHLIKVTTGAHYHTPTEIRKIEESENILALSETRKPEPRQLCFDLEDCG